MNVMICWFDRITNEIENCISDILIWCTTGSGQPGVNGSIPSLPSPTMPNFNMAAQTPNGQQSGNEAAAVYTNAGLQPYQGRKCVHRWIRIDSLFKCVNKHFAIEYTCFNFRVIIYRHFHVCMFECVCAASASMQRSRNTLICGNNIPICLV